MFLPRHALYIIIHCNIQQFTCQLHKKQVVSRSLMAPGRWRTALRKKLRASQQRRSLFPCCDKTDATGDLSVQRSCQVEQVSVSCKTIINRDHDIEHRFFIRHPARSEAQSQDPEKR
jgi:hypothetical protein